LVRTGAGESSSLRRFEDWREFLGVRKLKRT